MDATFWLGMLIPIVLNSVILKIYDSTRIARLKRITEFQSDTVTSLVNQAIHISEKIISEIVLYCENFEDSLANNGLEEDGPLITKRFFNEYISIKECIDRFIVQAEISDYAIPRLKRISFHRHIYSIRRENKTIYSILSDIEPCEPNEYETPIDFSLNNDMYILVRNKYSIILSEMNKVRNMLVTV